MIIYVFCVVILREARVFLSKFKSFETHNPFTNIKHAIEVSF